MRALNYLRILRPAQWLKNLMLLFPSFLGGSLMQAGAVGKSVIPLASFCLASSATYIFNDILDAEKDAQHPVKRGRPIASGVVSRGAAAVISLVLFLAAASLSLWVSELFSLILIAYLTVSVVYSIKLKEMPIVDIFCISAGFLLRLKAGGEAFKIAVSDWLFLSVFFLAIFLSTGKRLCEKTTLGEVAGNHRKTLVVYPDSFLDGIMYMTGASVLVTYTMYVIQRPALVYTVPLCTFGLLRYYYRVKVGQNGDPTESLLKDPVLFCVGLLWTGWIGVSIYG